MRIYKAKDYNEMSRKAANIISAQIIMKPDAVLGLATGSSPIGTYKQLIDWYNKGDLDFSEIRSVNLDEYKGLDASNPQSYAYFMRHNLFDSVNIKLENTNISIVDAIVLSKIAPSKGQARTLINQGGISLNDSKVTDVTLMLSDNDFKDGYAILKKGKKVFHKLEK